MRKLTILFAAYSLGIMSCGNGNESKKEEKTNTTAPAEKLAPTSKLSADGTSKTMAMVSDYYELKDAFVATNATQADAAANKLNTSVDVVITALQQDNFGKNQVVYMDTIKMETKKMLALKDETAEKKRVNFEKISDVMYVYLKNIDLKNAGVYREFCPMAFNDKGAYWLSNETEIKNPYFGKKMLECGEVTDSLK